MQVVCINCEKNFEKSSYQIKKTKGRNFCSRSCSVVYNNRIKPKRVAKVIPCESCDKTFKITKSHGSKVYCPNCVSLHGGNSRSRTSVLKKRTLKEERENFSLKGKHPSWVNSNIRNLNRSWNRGMRKLPCAKCGYDKHVELCHIRDITDFPEEATLEEVNHPNNILQLCRNCHWESANGYFSIEAIKERILRPEKLPLCAQEFSK